MKKGLSTLLIVLMLFNAVFAANFTDLGKAKWAEAYINRLAKMGIVTGYSDGSYKPLDTVSKYAAVLVVYRTLDSQGLVNQDAVKTYVNRYHSTLTKYSVPNWPNLHDAIAYSIEKKILEPKDLETFIVSNKHQNITREEMAKYLGKALNQFFKEDINKVFSLKYKDADKINIESSKYVNILSSHNIISGDTQGNFNPKKSLNRAALAKLIVVSIDELAKTKNVNHNEVEATVYFKLEDTQKISFYKKGSKTESYLEKIDDSVEILIGDKKATYNDLKVEMPVTLVYANDKLIRVVAQKSVQTLKTISGAVTERISFNGRRLLYFVNKDTGKTEFYELDKTTEIKKDDKPANFDDIQKEDIVTLGVDDGKVYTLSYKSKNETFTGVIKSITLDTDYKLTLKIGEGELTLVVASTADITRNDKKATVESLVEGDTITVETEFDKIVKVNAKGTANRVVGTIDKINIGDTFMVSIKNAEGKVKEYSVAKDATVTIDGQVKTYFDLRIGYRISAVIEKDAINNVRAVTKSQKRHLVGTVEKVYLDLGVLIVKADGNYTVNTSSSTLFVNAKGEKVTLSKIKVGEKVFVYGVLNINVYSAEKVYVVE